MRVIQNPYHNAIHRAAYDLICNSLLVDAHELLIEYLQAEENNDETWQLLGMIAAVQNDGETADTLLKQAHQLNPENTLTLKLLGQIAIERNDSAKAIQWFNRAKTLAPDDKEIDAALALAYSAGGKTKKASAFFAQSAAEGEQRPEFLFNAALFCANEGRFEEARGLFAKLLEIEPQHLNARIQLINVLQRMDRKAEAVDILRSAVALEPESESLLIELAEALFEHRKDDNRDEVVALATRNWHDQDCLVRSLYLLAKLNEHETQHAEAERHFEAATKLAPMNPMVRLGAGEYFLSRLNFALAFTNFIAAHGCASDDEDIRIEAMLGVVRCAYRSGAPELGEAFLAEHLEAESDKVRHKRLLKLASSLIQDKQLAAAEKHLRTIVDEDPENRPAHEFLAQALNDQDKTDEAFDFLIEAVKRFPRSYYLHFQLSVACMRIGEYETGIRHIRRALRLKKHNYEARGNLAVLLAESGQPSRALSIYNQLFEEDPEHHYADQLRMNRSITLMARGRTEEGLNEYKIRHRLYKNRERHAYENVDGDYPSFAGKKVLVICEQGIGDEILFAQFVPQLIDEGASSVTVEVSQKLLPLFRRSFPNIVFVPRQKQGHVLFKDAFDCQIVMGDLMLRHFRKHGTIDVPRRPFLVPDAQRVAWWRQRLDALRTDERKLNIGIAWRSSLQTGRRKQFWPPIEQWERIMRHEGVNWITLQYDYKNDELDRLREQGAKLHTFPEVDQFDDIDEVAALTRSLDLVVSAPVSVPMIAGAVGTPAWAFEPRFEWSLFGSRRIPIMPYMRPFIRGYRESWETTVDRLLAALDHRLSRH